MRKLTLILLAMITLAAAAPRGASAGEEILYARRPVSVFGKQNRVTLRHTLYAKTLRGDKLAVYEEHGLTPYRLREDRGVAGVTERWRYPALGLEYRFDAEGRLLATRRVKVGDRVFD